MNLVIPPLAAETMFQIGSFPVTNAYINSILTVILFGVFAVFLNFGIKKYYTNNLSPKGIVNFMEGALEFILSYCDKVTQDRKKSLKFLPIVGGLFLFILISNWLGLVPGTGSIGIWQTHLGKIELVPLFRPANTDLNMTMAMAFAAITASHFIGILAIGFFKYVNKFLKFGDLFKAIISLKPMRILTVVIEFFVGLIEIFSEIAKMTSLSLRLYGNIFAGEVLLTVLASLIAFGIPLPFIALEIIVGLVQATVFAMLTLVYLNIAASEPHGAEHAH